MAEATDSNLITWLAISLSVKKSWHAAMNVALAEISPGVRAKDLGETTTFGILASS